MDVIRKDATITNTGSDDDFPGSFHVVLSAPTEDRDGETLLAGDWKMPLPDHITFDTDHGMSVASTVGSGVPSLDAEGRLIVEGTYSSLPRAQETRTLVREKHIRTTSVAFMKVKANQKDGKQRTVRELLNGAFVAIPSNRESVVLNSKALDVDEKGGARNSKTDKERIQAIHGLATQVAQHAVSLGADTGDDAGAEAGAVAGKTVRMVAAKAVDGSYEQREQAISDALQAQYPGEDMWAYCLATFDDSIVYRVSGAAPQLQGQWQAPYTYDNGVATLGQPEKVNLVEQIVPTKSFAVDETVMKNVEGEPAADESADAAATAAASADDSAAEAEAIQKRAQHIRALALTSIGDF